MKVLSQKDYELIIKLINNCIQDSKSVEEIENLSQIQNILEACPNENIIKNNNNNTDINSQPIMPTEIEVKGMSEVINLLKNIDFVLSQVRNSTNCIDNKMDRAFNDFSRCSQWNAMPTRIPKTEIIS